ncbi:MAG: tandem-95 repeat protein, partial [Calditrichales bacterium]
MRALSFLFRICSIFLVFLFTNNSLFAQVPPDVIITEVYDHPVAYGEFVEIYNAGPVSQNLNGWQLSQTFSAFSTTLNSTSLRSGDLTLSPGEYAVIGRGSAAQFREVWGFLPATYFSVGTTGAPQIDGEEYMYIWNAAGGVEDYFGTRGFQFDVTVGHYTRNMATYPNDGRLATSWFTDGYYGNPGTDNFAPVAVNDQVSVNEDLSIQIPILTNDNDLDGALMSSTVILRSQPTRGTATLFRGVVTYTPQANYYGLDSFTYTVRDNDGATSNVATVSITVNSVNDRPVAVDDRADTDEDRAVIISVLANDSDIDGTLVPSSVRVGTVPTNGRTTVIADGTIRYTPNADYYGTDSFTYVVDDNSGARSNTATVSLRVFSINDPPRTNADAAVTDEERMVEIDVLANDTDIDGRIDASSLRVSAQPANGEVRFNPTTGLFEYAPNRDFFGIDAFRYTVNDDLGATSPETRVTITVNNINDAPHVVNDLAETDEDRNVLISILANDSDSDGTINPASIVITTAPLHGTTGINFTEGIVTFIPTGNYYGSDSFRYTVRDNNGATSAQATVNITIHSVNDAPVANRDAVETNEDTPVIINVLANDTDIDGVLVPASVNAIQTLNGRGTFSVNTTTGAITYTPYANVSGEDGVLYTVEDDSGAVSNQTWAMITILPQNDPPVAGNDNAAVNEDESVVINVLSNDSDPDGSLVPSSVIIATAPRSGSTSVNSTTGAITYTPDANYFGNDAFQYTVNDNEGGVSNRATVSVTIRSVNDIPIAQDDLSSVDEDGSVVVNVLVNDSDADGSLVAASVTVVTQPQSGSTSVNPGTGAVTYTPNANYNGNDSFQYTVRDNSGDTSNRATVRITVNPVNDVPVAQDDQATVDEDRSVVINVLVNDRDPDGSLDASTVTVVTQPLSGSASVNPSTGAVTYTPAANYNGSDSFTYRVRDDGNAVSNTATVTITVNSVNDPPVAMNDLANTDEDTGVIINVLANDTDVDGTLVPGSVTVVGNPAHGSTSVNASNGAVTYTPTAAWSGNDSFTYTVRDNDGGTSLPATVNISVGAVNDAPLAVNDNAETDEDTAVLINVLTNDSDSDGNLVASTVALNSQPAHGTAQVNPANGQINYIPVENYFGPDQFTYTVDDNNDATSNAATVSITVNSVNDPPVAIDDNANTNEDTEVIIDVLVNDTDVDGTLVPASVTVVGNPGHGSTSVNPATGAVTYTPAAAWSGADSFTYTVRDNQGGVSAAATVNVDVGAVNDIPLAVNDNAETDEDIPVQINVLANDSDSDGTLVPSSVEIVGQPANGNANVNTSNGIITYNPNAGWSGIDTFRYRVSDNQGGVSAPATVTVNVGAVNDPPLAINDLVETNEDTPVAINVLTNDSDSDGSLVLASVNISALPANGNA